MKRQAKKIQTRRSPVKPKQPRKKAPPKFKAYVEIGRGDVKLHIERVPSHSLSSVIVQALASLKGAGVRRSSNDDDRPLEQIGNYAPLEVRDDPYEQSERPKRVGF